MMHICLSRSGRTLRWFLVAGAGALGCSSGSQGTGERGPTGSGGTPSFAGTATTGGAVGSGGFALGGTNGSGGASTTGGVASGSSGAANANGGGGTRATATGGSDNSMAGRAPSASGGMQPNGGAAPFAGAGGRANGGRSSMGGAAMNGGAGGGAAGGAMNSAGAATGGGSNAGDCPDAAEPIGWATESGDGVPSTTGGLAGETVTPTSASELTMYAASDDPLVIRIQGSFDVPRLQVNSNKTLIGVGTNATINGGVRIRGSSSEPVKNVIFRNLRVNGATSDADDDAMQIVFAHHVWVDHCEIWDGPDGNLDITHASSWITVSWTKFRYTTAYMAADGEESDHRFSSLIGHSDDNSSEDTNRLKISLHHNWWAERVIERMPRVRFGQVHVFNNYYSSTGNNYCIGGGVGAQLLVQNNYFDGVKDPHRFQDDDDTAQIVANGNKYVGVADTTTKATRGSAFTPPYTVNLEAADDSLKARVMKCAGPR